MRQQLMTDLVEEYEGHLPALEEKIKHLTIDVRGKIFVKNMIVIQNLRWTTAILQIRGIHSPPRC